MYDSQILDFDIGKCFDLDTIHWYRDLFGQCNPTQESGFSNKDFLHQQGFLAEKSDQLRPTRASILLFGTQRYVLQILARPVVDLQWINVNQENYQPDQRWEDRLVHEGNLVRGWQALVEFYARHRDVVFSIKADDLQRTNSPSESGAFREACVNILIHQDYADQGRTPFIHFYRNKIMFRYPGASNLNRETLLELGEKTARNPIIMRAFHQIGLSEKVGTGISTPKEQPASLADSPKLGLAQKNDAVISKQG